MSQPPAPNNFIDMDAEFNAIRENFIDSIDLVIDNMQHFLHATLNQTGLQIPVESLPSPSAAIRTTTKALVNPAGPHSTLPVVCDRPDPNRMRLRINLQQFAPDEVQVQVRDGRLQVHAKHAEHTPGRNVACEFRYEVSLPADLPASAVRMNRGDDGVLFVEAGLGDASQRKPLTQ